MENTTSPDGIDRATASLEIDFCGEVRPLRETDSLLFGRGAELDIDSNPRLHRQLGLLERRDGWWWLANVGRSIPMHLADPHTGAAVTLPPGTQTALTSREVIVAFQAGNARYELRLTQSEIPVVVAPKDAVSMTSTSVHENLPLNFEQRQLLAALCELKLTDPAGPLTLPTNREIYERLGWGKKKFDSKLDYLCERFARQGVAGLQRDSGRALDRRKHLAEWVLMNKLVTTADLELLP